MINMQFLMELTVSVKERSFVMLKKRLFGRMILIVGIMLALALGGCDFSSDNGTNGKDPGGNNGNNGNNGNDPGGGNGGNSGSGINPTITIKNSTGYTISGIYIKRSTETQTWGYNLYEYRSLSDGSSREYTLSQPLTNQSVCDIRLSQNSNGEGYNFRKYGVTISNGMTLTFTTSDLNDGSVQPKITIKNRSGKNFNSFYIKPTVISDWGTSFGSITNNDERSVTILIPPTNYTVFDIQMRSSNPTNTYTRSNVTVSNDLVFTYTSADADNPTIELPVIVIQNNTGYTISGIYIKPSTSTSWGNNLYEYRSLPDGSSRAYSLSQHLSSESVYDIRLTQNSNASGLNFTKYNFTVSEGIIVTFSTSDLVQ